jgi:hypothetical protein
VHLTLVKGMLYDGVMTTGQALPRIPLTEQLFGRPTGQHTHPDTHPHWLVFVTATCPVCTARAAR